MAERTTEVSSSSDDWLPDAATTDGDGKGEEQAEACASAAAFVALTGGWWPCVTKRTGQ